MTRNAVSVFKTRLVWVDQARGLSIFLVAYGHLFPAVEPYMSCFQIPLFLLISGMFHPKNVNVPVIKRRAYLILTPYFIWSFLLFMFWWAAGRKFGQSAQEDLSPLKNFIGIFYAQGGQEYMDWGIPMWFMPFIFMVFLIFAAVQKITSSWLKAITITVVVFMGFLWTNTLGISLPWSLHLAFVGIGFYSLGYATKNWLSNLTFKKTLAVALLALAIHLFTFRLNAGKVDFYRAQYGTDFYFFISGLFGAVAYLLFFKLLPFFTFLSYIGRHTIVILATHLRMLTVIKGLIILAGGSTLFMFSEIEKLGLAVLQILLLVPVIWFINAHAPILDGKTKKI